MGSFVANVLFFLVEWQKCIEMAEEFFSNIGTKIEKFFGGGDSLPWTDSEIIAVSFHLFMIQI